MVDSTSEKRDTAETGRAPDPCTLVIFGASGDLTRRKLVPALYNLLIDDLMPERFSVVGVARRELSNEAFAESLRLGIESFSRRPLDETAWKRIRERVTYVSADTDDEAGYRELATVLDEADRRHETGGNRLFYLATPPSAFPVIVKRLGEAGLHRPAKNSEGWRRLVLEKPIGRDLESARTLNRQVNRVFREKDVFRIDHYLGKETVQNLLVFRFANAIFEPLWNQKYVDHVQITVAESIGVGSRGAYFEEAGMTRDMMQNHMFQLLCLTAMEPPVSLEADAIRDEKVKVLQALRPVEAGQVRDCTVRGQYASGVVGNEAVGGYKEEPGVSAESRTETYVGARLHIDNWRWANVPFYLRAGKRLQKRVTEIALQFYDVPHRLFEHPPSPNRLTLRIQPDEGITLRVDAKAPGNQTRIQAVNMDFRYGTSFGAEPPEAYERLILDAMHGDSTLFIRRDEVEASWAWIDRLQEGWSRENLGEPLHEYTAGSWGPAEAHVMLGRDGRTWNRL